MILLNEFASHIDAPFGLEVLKNLYKSGNELDELKACIATLHLVRYFFFFFFFVRTFLRIRNLRIVVQARTCLFSRGVIDGYLLHLVNMLTTPSQN